MIVFKAQSLYFFKSFFQILFIEFVDWALEKNLDIEDDVDVEIPDEEKDE
jgi:hypothetical protein